MDYSERISHNEQRIAELKGRIYTDKLTIKSLVKENEKCVEAMNNCTKVVNTDLTNKDKKILKLTKQLDSAKNTIVKLKNKNSDLSIELIKTKKEIKRMKEKELFDLCYNSDESDDLISENICKNNIFNDFLERNENG